MNNSVLARVEPQYDFYEVACGIDTYTYLARIGAKEDHIPFDWQRDVCRSPSKRKIICGARQSGKSDIVSAKSCHRAKYFPKSLILILAPTEDQAKIDMGKILEYISWDESYPTITAQNARELKLSNRSEIKIIIASERSARGYSKPSLLILDEASRIGDEVYKSGVRPMLTKSPDSELILISTPYGKRGFFYEAWIDKTNVWDKYEVRSPWETNALDQWTLYEHHPGPEFFEERKRNGVKFYYSPRHDVFDEQQENLRAMTIRLYRQEYCCEFVETDEAVFTYQDLQKMFEENLVEASEDEPQVAAGGLLIPKKIGGKFF